MKYLISLIAILAVSVQAQVVNLTPTITELRVTRSDTGQTLVFSSLMSPELINPFAPKTFDAAINKAKAWATECKCQVFVRDSLYFNGRVLLSSNSSSSRQNSINSSSSVSVRSSVPVSSLGASSSRSSQTASSLANSSVSTGSVDIVAGRPTERENGEYLDLTEIKEYQLWYDDSNYDIILSTGDDIRYTTNYPRNSQSQWKMYTIDMDGLSSKAENVLM